MTYTNVWSTNRPLGSAQANQIDDEIRALRLDLQERIGLIFEDMGADPVVIDQTKFGAATGKTLIVHGSAFTIEGSGLVNYDDTGLSEIASDSGPVRAWVPLPGGVSITKIEWLMSNTDTAPISVSFGCMSFELGMGVEVLNAMSSSASGASILDSGDIVIPVQNTKTYFLKADKGGGGFFGLRAVKITYNCPDGRSTI